MQVMKLLKELDQYLLPKNQGQSVEAIYRFLEDRYCPDSQIEIKNAHEWFATKSYNYIKEQLDMFSQPPINAHAANIISKIKDYLNAQVLDMYT